MKPEDVPRDIYNLLANDTPPEGVDVEDILDRFAEAAKQAIRDALGPDQKSRGRLRLSAIGKPDRQILMRYMGSVEEPLSGNTRVKFLFGHLTECMLVALTELSGHEVTELQKECEVEGVKGSQDCRIDGVLADIKSASSYGFKKFKDGSLAADDPFGYVAQIKGYAAQEGDTTYGWLAFDKQHGHICWLQYDETNTSHPMHKHLDWDVKERVREIKKLVGECGDPSSLPYCHSPVPDGNSGNEKLAIGCSYCSFKHNCYDLRTFLYSTGPRYLTKVENEPRVVELVEGF